MKGKVFWWIRLVVGVVGLVFIFRYGCMGIGSEELEERRAEWLGERYRDYVGVRRRYLRLVIDLFELIEEKFDR